MLVVTQAVTPEEPLCRYQSFDPISEGLKVDIGLPASAARDSLSHKLLTIITNRGGERGTQCSVGVSHNAEYMRL